MTQHLIKRLVSNKHNLLLVCILMLGLLLRVHKFEYLPFQSDADELAHVFAGQSLLQKGIPISWSSFNMEGRKTWSVEKLGNEALHSQDTFTFVYPWFDHPPLLALIQGMWTNLLGYTFPTMLPSMVIRLPMLALSLVSLMLIYAVTRDFFGKKSAIFSLALASFSPSLAVGHRMVTGENLFIPIMLFSLLLVKRGYIKTVILLNMLAIMSKITGVLSLGITVFYLLLYKQYKKAVIVGVSSVMLFASLYLFYGYIIDFGGFAQALQAQAGRLVGWSNPAFLFSHPGFRNAVVFDMSYYLFLIFGIGYFINRELNKEDKFLLFCVLSSLLLVWVTSAELDMLGWYKLPLFTFLSIVAGRSVVNGKYSIAASFFIFIVAINNFGIIKFPEHPFPNSNVLRITITTFTFIITITLISFFADRVKFRQLLATLALVTLCLSSFRVVHLQYAAQCKDARCPVPSTTLPQEIKLIFGGK